MDINFWSVLLISAVIGWAISVTTHLVAIRQRLDQIVAKLYPGDLGAPPD